MSEGSKAVFLSYASQDAAAVERIAEALRAAGVEVWFDKNELVGGDAWDAKIRGQIASCALFVPVISAATQARLEGYFRVEWKLAARRTHAMATAKAFLLPIVIDGTHDGEAHVPDEFREVQWTRLPGGDTPAAFCARVGKLLGGEGREASPRRPSSEPTPNPGHLGETSLPAKPSRPWIVPAIIGAAAVLGLALWQPWRGKENLASPAALVPTNAPISEARKLVAQARALFDDGDDSNQENFFLADDLLKKASALDSTDGEVWAAQAELSADIILRSYDRSAARLQMVRTQAERAVKLAPGSAEAQLAYAGYLTVTGYLTPNGEQFASEALELVRKLKLTSTQQSRAWSIELFSMVVLGRLDEWKAAVARSDAPQQRDALVLARASGQFLFMGWYADAEAFNARSLAVRKTARAQLMDVALKLTWRGDLDGAAAALAEWPAWVALEDRGVVYASQVWLWRREPDKALAVLAPVSRDFLNDSTFVGPKAVLVALAQEMAGNAQAARAAWEDTKRVAIRVAAEQTADQRVLVWKAVALARLGETAEAETIFRQLEQTKVLRSEFWSCTAPSALLRIALGHGADVVAKFDTELRSNSVRTPAPTPRAALRLNPVFDPIRATPEFQKWMAGAPAPEEKKENKTSAAPAPAVNEKSLVVLPLENLSPDPENAFFTDGMHAEIIATLQRIPDLKVTSRDSAMAFKGSTAPLAEKAQKVAAAHAVSGSVRRAGTSVRVQLELRRARDDALLWTQTYDKELGVGVIAIQSDIADQVARVLQARERKGTFAGAQFMTANPEAYDLFLKASQAHYNERTAVGRQKVIAGLEQALKLDPKFSSAAHLLAGANTQAFRVSSARIDPAERKHFAHEAKRWAEATSRLLPGGAGDAALAGYYTEIEPDNARSLALIENAVNALPSDGAVQNQLAIVLFEAGRSAESLPALHRAIGLDPFNRVFWANLLHQLVRLRRVGEYAKVEADFVGLTGQTAARAVKDPNRFRLFGELPSTLETYRGIDLATWLRRARRDAESLAAIEGELAVAALSQVERWRILIEKCDVLRRMVRESEALAAAQAAQACLEKIEAEPEFDLSERDLRRAVTLARLGRAEEAIDAGRRYVAARLMENQVRSRWRRETDLAAIYAYLHRPKECVELLARLLRVPSDISVPMLKVDPAWDNVREDAGFKALLADPKNSAPL